MILFTLSINPATEALEIAALIIIFQFQPMTRLNVLQEAELLVFRRLCVFFLSIYDTLNYGMLPSNLCLYRPVVYFPQINDEVSGLSALDAATLLEVRRVHTVNSDINVPQKESAEKLNAIGKKNKLNV